MSNASLALPPGFRFHPTDEELMVHYLWKRAASTPCPVAIIAEVDIYKFNPWDLPAKAMFGEREWYFFSPRDRKYPNGVRPNRAAASGYWKATGTDKPITTGRGNENIGVKKALVFYKGKPPRGLKTNWIMHEYRLTEAQHNIQMKPVKPKEGSMRLDDWVLCRIYRKARNHSSVDSEEVDSAVEDEIVQNLTNTNKMHKSLSLSELLMEEADFPLLSRLLEAPMNVPIADHAPLSNTSLRQSFTEGLSNTNVSFLNSQVTQSDSCGLVGEKCLKRQTMVDDYYFDEGGGQLNPSKKLIKSDIYSQFNNQFDMSQPFFNHNLLLSSHLGM